MADGFTNALLLRQPEEGAHQNGWAPILNEDFGSDRLEEAIVGVASYALTGEKELTRENGETDEARMRVQVITGGSGGTVTIPAVPIWYWFVNLTANDAVVTNGSNSVTVKAGNVIPVISDDGTLLRLGLALDYGSALPKSSGTATDPREFITLAQLNATAFSSALPTASAPGFLKTNGTAASWAALLAAEVTTALGYTPTSITGLTGTKSVTEIKAGLSLGNVENKSSATIRDEFKAASNSFTAKQTMAASAAAGAGLSLGVGTAPTAPSDGDVWATTEGMFIHADGATIGPLMSQGRLLQSQNVAGLTAISFTSLPSDIFSLVIVLRGVTNANSQTLQIQLSTDNGGSWSPIRQLQTTMTGGDSYYGSISVEGLDCRSGVIRNKFAKTISNGEVSGGEAPAYEGMVWRMPARINGVRLSISGIAYSAGSIDLWGQ